jgi:hypothetical protein
VAVGTGEELGAGLKLRAEVAVAVGRVAVSSGRLLVGAGLGVSDVDEQAAISKAHAKASPRPITP